MQGEITQVSSSSQTLTIHERIRPALDQITAFFAKIGAARVPLRRFHDQVVFFGVTIGASAFGLWWHSIAAAIFACFVLSFIAGIYQKIGDAVGLALLREQARAPSLRVPSDAPVRRNYGAADINLKAIERLQPWVADQASLSEESAKVYCAVLLDLVAAVYPQASGKQFA